MFDVFSLHFGMHEDTFDLFSCAWHRTIRTTKHHIWHDTYTYLPSTSATNIQTKPTINNGYTSWRCTIEINMAVNFVLNMQNVITNQCERKSSIHISLDHIFFHFSCNFTLDTGFSELHGRIKDELNCFLNRSIFLILVIHFQRPISLIHVHLNMRWKKRFMFSTAIEKCVYIYFANPMQKYPLCKPASCFSVRRNLHKIQNRHISERAHICLYICL